MATAADVVAPAAAPAAAPSTIRVVNPATGELIAELPDAGRAGVLSAVAAARRAQPGWAALPVKERLRAIRRWRKALLDDPELPAVLVRESGKPRHEAEAIEVLYFCELVRFYGVVARRALASESRSTLLMATRRAEVLRKPLGVVGVVGPWNFPLLNNAADALAPLLAGNAVVLKPSEVTPLTSLRMAELWRRAGNPEGVFQVVVGRGETGAAVVDEADGVMFTGSVATGRRVAARCGERLVPCVTELGGKAPFVVLAGADLPRAARAAAWSSFFTSGQACIRTERILVEEPVADAFERLLVERVKALRQAVPDPEGAREQDLGSVTVPRQVEVAEGQLAEATAHGARVLTGGARRTDLPGLFFEPTLVAGATPEMEMSREETFGPLVGITRVKDAEEALRLANASHLGLNATVFGPEREARALARRIESGNVIVNDVLVNYLTVAAPLGGVKASGLGARHGAESLRQWTRTTVVNVGRPLLAPVNRLVASLFAFPYRQGVLGLVRRLTRLLP